jgi:alginate O-acetyltransferase complex protein AlgI
MLFNTFHFAYFFGILFPIYWALRKRLLAQNILLLAAAYYFYGCWNPKFLSLLILSTVMDYFCGLAVDRFEDPKKRKACVAVSMALNLGMLGYFKYYNFFADSLQALLARSGMHVSMPVLNVVLPIGISFYTFEAISYVIDVSRGRVRAERNLAHFLLFILFFPHLVAGPIVRAGDFLPQVRRRKRWNWPRAELGLQLILLGVVKKVAIADRLALYADPVYADPATFATATVWLAAAASFIQIYCDFSGYSDMALGLAHLLGFHLTKNFDLPLLAPNLAAFWQRWHISLSTWLKHFVFTPLGGARRGRWVYHRNVLIVMAVSGMWHGAGWNFLLFGLAHGGLLFIHRQFRDWADRRPALRASMETAAGRALRIAVTFTTVVLTVVLFRTTTLAAAGAMYARMLWPARGAGLPLDPRWFFGTLATVAVGHAVGAANRDGRAWRWLPRPAHGLAFGATAALALVLAPPADRLFVSFQF